MGQWITGQCLLSNPALALSSVPVLVLVRLGLFLYLLIYRNDSLLQRGALS